MHALAGGECCHKNRTMQVTACVETFGPLDCVACLLPNEDQSACSFPGVNTKVTAAWNDVQVN